MDDFLIVETFQSIGHVDKGIPDLGLRKVDSLLLILLNPFLDISTGCELHDDVESQSTVVEEGFFIAHHVFAVFRGQDPDFVESVLSIFLGHGVDFDLMLIGRLLFSWHRFIHLRFF
jgi:hypothetical protein